MRTASIPSLRPKDAIAALLARAALAAGEAIAAVHACGLEARRKEDGSPCTNADIAAQETILAALDRDFPGTVVVAEESAAQAPSDLGGADTFLLVDPLDGTGEFLAGGREYCVCIALIEGRRPVAGTLLAPALRKLWVAGESALLATPEEWGKGISQPVRVRKPAPDGLVALGSLRHGDSESSQFCGRFQVRETRMVSSAVKFGLIASGEADLYPRFGATMEWDTAAGQALLEAAGGCVTDPTGEPLTYGHGARGFLNGPFIAWGDPRMAERLRSP
jgi:3'(2'), 5'-bisphosphate nucleotidase